jgi:hypothetical protein
MRRSDCYWSRGFYSSLVIAGDRPPSSQFKQSSFPPNGRAIPARKFVTQAQRGATFQGFHDHEIIGSQPSVSADFRRLDVGPITRTTEVAETALQ